MRVALALHSQLLAALLLVNEQWRAQLFVKMWNQVLFEMKNYNNTLFPICIVKFALESSKKVIMSK